MAGHCLSTPRISRCCSSDRTDSGIKRYGDRPGAHVSEGLIRSWWNQGMMCGHKNGYDCIKAFWETDFTEDLKKFEVPTLIIHGEDDQIVPIDTTAKLAVKLVPNARLKVYPGGSHGLGDTDREKLNANLLEFARS